MHAEVAIGNAAIEVSDGNEQYPTAPAAIHLYVDDPDAAYAAPCKPALLHLRANRRPSFRRPLGRRQRSIRQSLYIATPKHWTPGLEGLRSVQPYLHLREAHKMIPFMEAALGEALGVAKSPEGACCTRRFESGTRRWRLTRRTGIPADAVPLHVYVPDTDAVYARRCGGQPRLRRRRTRSMGTVGGVKDAWSNSWFIATYLGNN